MYAVSQIVPLAVLWNAQIVRWGVWVGLVVLTLSLLILIRTRWGQSQPLGKCVVLSLLAHLLLGIYMTTVDIVSSSVGSPDGKGIQVALIDGTAASGNSDDPPRAEPWNSFATDFSEFGADPAATDMSSPKRVTELPPVADPARQVVEEKVVLPPTKLPALPTVDAGPPALAAMSDPLTMKSAAKQAEPIEIPQPTETPDPVPPPEPVTASLGNDAATEKAPTPSTPTASSVVKSGAEANDVTPPLVPLDGGDRTGVGQGLGESATAPPPPPKSVPNIYKLRMGDHSQVAKGQGATQDSEAAVTAALKYLAANQSANGNWNARGLGGGARPAADGQDRHGAGSQADTGITGLSLLAFLAAGHTHLQGPHQATVRRGLEFLLSKQDTDHSLGASPNNNERMYCHAMATCALSEAYAMTQDERLQLAVRRAIGYSIAAQDRVGGGWRYAPGESGDTSQMGWQVMALKSAQLAGITIPDQTRDGIGRFLKSVTVGRDGGLACYQPNRRIPSRSMSAEALACRQFMSFTNNPAAVAEAREYLLEEMPGSGVTNHYYWYYATLAMCQMQGESWQRWNEALQKTLLASQRQDGQWAGSWDPDPVWGGCGGRAYSTALCTLCLEVYYRFLPLHVEAAGRERRAK